MYVGRLPDPPFPSCECGRYLIHRQSFALYSSMSAEGERPGTFGTEEEEEEEDGGTLALFGRGSGVMAAAFVKAGNGVSAALRKRQTGLCHAMRTEGEEKNICHKVFSHFFVEKSCCCKTDIRFLCGNVQKKKKLSHETRQEM